MKVDKTNIALMRHLRDGRKSYKEIAEALSLAENTVRARVNRMMAEGILDISGLMNVDGVPDHSVVFFGVCLANTNLVQKGEEFSRLRGVISASIVTGRYDLMVVTLFNQEFGLIDFVTQEVTKISDVQSTEAFVAYKSWDLKAPYVL